MGETVLNVLLLVRKHQPAGIEELVGDRDFTGWTWEVAGGPFCLVKAPNGDKWAFEPDEDTYWDRLTDRVYGGAGECLMGKIRPIANLKEWQGLACYAQRLEVIRIQAIAATSMGAGTTRINATIKACLEAGKAAYTAIVQGSCPLLAACEALSRDLEGEHALCGAVFPGTDGGVMDLSELMLWDCHRPVGHPGICDATKAATGHCCVPRVLSSVSSVISPPYERGWFWSDYLPGAAAALAR